MVEVVVKRLRWWRPASGCGPLGRIEIRPAGQGVLYIIADATDLGCTVDGISQRRPQRRSVHSAFRLPPSLLYRRHSRIVILVIIVISIVIAIRVVMIASIIPIVTPAATSSHSTNTNTNINTNRRRRQTATAVAMRATWMAAPRRARQRSGGQSRAVPPPRSAPPPGLHRPGR